MEQQVTRYQPRLLMAPPTIAPIVPLPIIALRRGNRSADDSCPKDSRTGIDLGRAVSVGSLVLGVREIRLRGLVGCAGETTGVVIRQHLSIRGRIGICLID